MDKYLIIIITFLSYSATSQDVEIGQWRDYLPYENGQYLAYMDEEIYVATENTMFRYHPQEKIITRIGKKNGLSDVGISVMKKSPQQDLILVAYENGNIDLLSPNQTINISDIKRANIIGTKSINSIVFYQQKAYLSCSFGIIVLDINKKEIKNTFYLNNNQSLNINDLIILENNIYAASDSGIFIGSLNQNLSDYQKWSKTSITESVNQIALVQQQIYFNNLSDSVYLLNNNEREYIATQENLRTIKSLNNQLYLLSRNNLHILTQQNQLEKIVESSVLYRANDIIKIDNDYWLAEGIKSLVKIDDQKRLSFYRPEGPKSDFVFYIKTNNEKLFISPGGISTAWSNNNTYKGFYWSDGYKWKSLSYNELGPIDIRDITTIEESADGKLFLATWNDGIIQLKYNSQSQNYEYQKSHNYFTSNTNLNSLNIDPNSNTYGRIRIKDIVFDQQGDLWAANSLVENALARMNSQEQWQSYKIKSFNTQSEHVGDLLIDDNNQKWFYIAKGGGIIVFNDNNTPDITNDDQDIHLTTTQGRGGLPSNLILSLTKDKDGEIWIGTDKGIAVFYNPENIFEQSIINAQQILIEADGYVEPILANESISAIEVDGANRKWIGTQNSGLFLYSPDGSEQIQHFTQSNSPLLSNTITHLSINGQSGELFIGTSKGLVSYKSGAIEGQEQHSNVLVYPNPVRETYQGPIAIKNVVNNADVKITDINGGLVAQFAALGGQAVWDGLNRNGQRVNTGVYLVFTTNELGTETNVAKILFIK